MKIFNYRLVILLLCIIFGVVFSIPSLLQTNTGKKIALGLDLQGGLHMLLGVNTHEAVSSKIKTIATTVKYFSDDEELLVDGLLINEDNVVFSVLDADEIAKMDLMLNEIKGLAITKNGLEYTIKLTPEDIIKTKDLAVAQAVETIRNRLDQFGLSEPNVVRQGESDIIVELPGIKTAEDEKAARELISKPANLELMAIDEEKNDQVNNMTNSQASSYGDVILEDTKNPNLKYLVKEIPILNGSQVIDAQVAFDQSNQAIINFTLNSTGARIFGDFTAKSVGKRLAVAEAGNVAIALRSGALPATVTLLEKRSIGPSLGADSIRASSIALVSGFLLVFGFMIIYYKGAGIVANVALIANVFLIIAIMAMFGATLTLPGMAGILLTIGMAVDANIIIIERIREVLREGASIPKAIEDGYLNAIRAIVDSNVTTLLVAVVLYVYGTGPIKGFAVTISIGIITSMITGILGTHGIYQALLARGVKTKNTYTWFGAK